VPHMVSDAGVLDQHEKMPAGYSASIALRVRCAVRPAVNAGAGVVSMAKLRPKRSPTQTGQASGTLVASHPLTRSIFRQTGNRKCFPVVRAAGILRDGSAGGCPMGRDCAATRSPMLRLPAVPIWFSRYRLPRFAPPGALLSAACSSLPLPGVAFPSAAGSEPPRAQLKASYLPWP
jgi:hypothetical protein